MVKNFNVEHEHFPVFEITADQFLKFRRNVFKRIEI